jgi:hypothetical protein
MGSIKAVQKQPKKKEPVSTKEVKGKDLWASQKHDAPRAFRNMMKWKGIEIANNS